MGGEMAKENFERFFPCNGTEGVSFVDDFCEHCIHEKWIHTQQSGDKQCEILSNSILYEQPCFDRDLKFDGWEWLINRKNREWKCCQYKYWDWMGDDENGQREPPTPPPDDPNQLIIFSFDEKIDELIKENELSYKA